MSTVAVWGTLSSGDLELVVRAVPPRDAATKPGFGLVIERGEQDRLAFRKARREELLPGSEDEAETAPKGLPGFRFFRKSVDGGD